MTADLTIGALDIAIWRRDRPLNGLVAHSDAGSQYTAMRYTQRLADIGAVPSIGTVGDSYDNAMVESFNGIYKTELVKPFGPWKTTAQLEFATFEYIDWYNNRRLHEQLGMITPVEKEAAYYHQHQDQQQLILP